MRTKNIKIVWIFFLVLIICSCEDFLNQKPSDSTLSNEAITTLDDAQVALNGVYRKMTDFGYYGRQFLLYADFKGGDLTPPSLGRGNDGLFTFTHDFNLGAYGELWDDIYNTILQTNNLLAAIDAGNVKVVSESDKIKLNNIKGEALTVRALAHFDLVRLYGYPYLKDNGASLGVAIVTEVLSAQTKLVRSTVDQTYQQIIGDLNLAINNLLKEKKTLGINQYAAKALLSRVYLYQGEYDKAYDLAMEVINSNQYQLYTNANWTASWNTDYGSESIFELPVVSGENDLKSNSPTHLLRPSYYQNGSVAVVASKIFYNLLSEDKNDVRWGIMGNETITDIAGLVIGRSGWVKKYEKSGGTANNLKIIRLSEMYLIASECAVKKQNPDKKQAAILLNNIRKRSPDLPVAQATDTNLLEEIMNESRKEFICEGQTYFNYLRQGLTVNFDKTLYPITAEGRGLQVDWNYYKCVLPISQDELLANPKIQQNLKYGVPR